MHIIDLNGNVLASTVIKDLSTNGHENSST